MRDLGIAKGVGLPIFVVCYAVAVVGLAVHRPVSQDA